MSDPRNLPRSGDDVNLETDFADDPRVQRWVKLSGLAAILLLASMIVVTLLSGGQHGPGRHVSSFGVATTSPTLAAADPTRAGGTS